MDWFSFATSIQPLSRRHVMVLRVPDAAAGQPGTYQISGVIDLGATLTRGEVYAVGAAAGGIAPVADPTTGDFMTVLGVAITTANLKIGINQSGVASA